MRDHAIVCPQFWTGETGRLLRRDPDAQRIAFYLMTCPHSNMIGLYYLPLPFICHEVGISEEGTIEALTRLSEGGFCLYDSRSETVFVKQMARYQIGEVLEYKDNRYKGVLRILNQMKNCIFYNDFLERYNEVYQLNLKPLPRPSQGAYMPLRSKDKEKEKDKEKDQDLLSPRSAAKRISDSSTTASDAVSDEVAAPAVPAMEAQSAPLPTASKTPVAVLEPEADQPLTPDGLIDLYNAQTPETVPKVKTRSPARLAKARQYLKQFPSRDWWLDVCEEIRGSPFLQGQHPRDGHESFTASFDWLLTKGKDGTENCVKVHDGGYRDPPKNGQGPGHSRSLDMEQRMIHNAQELMEETRHGSPYGMPRATEFLPSAYRHGRHLLR